MMSIATNLQQVRQRIETAKQQYGRVADTVKLLAVSKQQPAAAIREAYAAGLYAFGENYLQEALLKQKQLQDLALEWHYIGSIQTNKAALLAENFTWVHTLSRLKEAEKLNLKRPVHLPPLNCCIQVNVSYEDSKSGLAPKDVALLAEQIQAYPHLRLRGLMAIPAYTLDFNSQRQQCHALLSLYLELRKTYPELDTLSVGMSNDLEAAIAEGATLVRIGQAIFGSREET